MSHSAMSIDITMYKIKSYIVDILVPDYGGWLGNFYKNMLTLIVNININLFIFKRMQTCLPLIWSMIQKGFIRRAFLYFTTMQWSTQSPSISHPWYWSCTYYIIFLMIWVFCVVGIINFVSQATTHLFNLSTKLADSYNFYTRI